MHPASSLLPAQREAAVALFEVGLSYRSAAARLDLGAHPVKRLYDRWRLRGREVLMTKQRPAYGSYSFELKLEVVRKLLAGQGAIEVAREYDLSSGRLAEAWLRRYRREGEDGLRPKPKGRRPSGLGRDPDELERLRVENARLRAEIAYLGKLRALRAQGRQ